MMSIGAIVYKSCILQAREITRKTQMDHGPFITSDLSVAYGRYWEEAVKDTTGAEALKLAISFRNEMERLQALRNKLN